MKLKQRFQDIYNADRAIDAAHDNVHLVTQFSISFIVATAYLVLTIVNLVTASSTIMCMLTGGSCAVLYSISFIGYMLKRPTIIQYTEMLLCAVVFTIFVVIEGNNGFAALWIILGPLVAMTIVDLKSGFLTGLYFFIMLVTFFWTPVREMMNFQIYSEIFMLRFPLLYLVSFIFATYISIGIRKAQYRLLLQQEQLERYQASLENDLSKLTFQYESAEYRASHDKLTGLFNREHLQRLREDGEYSDLSSAGIVFFDINGMKYANDNHGHRAGDALLITAAESLQNSFGRSGRIFRIGGDEFLLIITKCTRRQAEMLILGWREELKRLNETRNTNCVIAVGCAFGNANSSDLDALIREADMNMYSDKKRLKNAE